MSKESYYGNADGQTISYLEFGSINIGEGKKEIWGYKQDQKAYDYYMFARYAEDLFAFRQYFNEEQKTVDLLNQYIQKSAHNKLLDYIFKYAGVITVLDENCENGICESGSSLYGLIDEVMACDYTFSNGENIEKIRAMKYLASDISEMMNIGAKSLHADIDMETSTTDTIKKLSQEVDKLSLFYGLSVSLRYALRETEDLVAIAKKSRLTILNRLSLSYGKTKILTYGTGKSVYIISLPELKQMLSDNGLYAEYSLDNMQFNKDGEDTVRASLVISESIEIIKKFQALYNRCVMQCKKFVGGGGNEWKNIKEL